MTATEATGPHMPAPSACLDPRRPAVRRYLVACLAAALSPLAASAQEGWQTYGGEGTADTGAVVCPLDGADADGRVFCFSLGCTEDAPLRFVVTLSGMPLPDAPVEAAVTVDGRSAGTLTLEPAEVDYGELATPWRQDAHADLVTALRRGRAATISIEGGGMAIAQPMSLTGSARALATAMEVCPAPRVPGAETADPAAPAASEGATPSSDVPTPRPETAADAAADAG